MPGSVAADPTSRVRAAVGPGTRAKALVAAPTPRPRRAWLDEVEAAFAGYDGHPDTEAAFAAASVRARAIAASAVGDDGVRSAALTFAADAITGLILERDRLAETVAEMVATAARILEIPQETASLELFMRAISNARLR